MPDPCSRRASPVRFFDPERWQPASRRRRSPAGSGIPIPQSPYHFAERTFDELVRGALAREPVADDRGNVVNLPSAGLLHSGDGSATPDLQAVRGNPCCVNGSPELEEGTHQPTDGSAGEQIRQRDPDPRPRAWLRIRDDWQRAIECCRAARAGRPGGASVCRVQKKTALRYQPQGSWELEVMRSCITLSS